MIHIQLSYNKGQKWFSKDDISVKGYIITPDNVLLKEYELINYFSTIHSFDEFKHILNEANGLFSVVIKRDNLVWLAVDHGRIFPLFYYQNEKLFIITDNPTTLKSFDVPFLFDEKNAVFLQYSGLAPDNKTIIKNVYQLSAGECVCFDNNSLKTAYHTEFLTTDFFTCSRDKIKENLVVALEKTGNNLIKLLNGRPVSLFLSSGYDSRVILYLLKKNNYSNVSCFTYGMKNSPELTNAEKIAKILDYEWTFIDYENFSDYSFVNDSAFLEYVNYSANYANKFYFQEYIALQYLINVKRIPDDTVFISGQSGSIAGHLLTKEMGNKNFSFADYIIENIFSLVYPKRRELKIIKDYLSFFNNADEKYPGYLLYENWRFKETTAKFGLNSLRLFDYFGYGFAIPLWDKELYSFFVKVPFEHKYDKNLFKETLSDLFKEYDIYFSNKELYPSKKLVKKVKFRSKVKKNFPFLKRFVDMWKIDLLGLKFLSTEFTHDLKKNHNYRKMLSANGIYSAWYIQKIKETFFK